MASYDPVSEVPDTITSATFCFKGASHQVQLRNQREEKQVPLFQRSVNKRVDRLF